MKKLIAFCLMIMFLAGASFAAFPVKPYTFVLGTTADPDEVNSNFDTLYNAHSSGLTDMNIYSLEIVGTDVIDSNRNLLNIDDIQLNSLTALGASLEVNSPVLFKELTVFSSASAFQDVVTFEGAVSVGDIQLDSLTANNTTIEVKSDISFESLATFITIEAGDIGAFNLQGKLTAGTDEIEGSNFDINGGTIDDVALTGGTITNPEFTTNNDIIFSAALKGLLTNTSDGSDNRDISIVAGGAHSLARGGQIRIFGNEFPGAGGNIRLATGQIATSEIKFLAGPSSTEYLTLKGSGTFEVNGNIQYDGQARARAYRNAAQGTTNDGAAYKVQLDAENYDSQNNFDSTTNNRFTAPTTGLYMITGQVAYAGAMTDQFTYGALIYVNGAEVTDARITASGTDSVKVQISDIRLLTAGDYIELYYITDNGAGDSGLDTGSEDTYMAVAKIG